MDELVWIGIMFPGAPSAVIKLRTEAESLEMAKLWPNVIFFFVDELEEL